MIWTIRVTDQQNLTLFENVYFDAEYEEVVDFLEDNKRRIGFFESLVIPIRTDNLKNFCQDFCLPTFTHYALRVNNLGIRIIASMVCLFLDLATLFLRAITLIPRYCYNWAHQKEAHPLYQYLLEQEVDSNDLSHGHVQLAVEWAWDRYWTMKQVTFNFMQLPQNISAIHDVFSEGEAPCPRSLSQLDELDLDELD